jgi:hypothetical protein
MVITVTVRYSCENAVLGSSRSPASWSMIVNGGQWEWETRTATWILDFGFFD